MEFLQPITSSQTKCPTELQPVFIQRLHGVGNSKETSKRTAAYVWCTVGSNTRQLLSSTGLDSLTTIDFTNPR